MYVCTICERNYEPILTGLEAICSENQPFLRLPAAFLNFCLIFFLKGKKYASGYKKWVFLCYSAYFCNLWKNDTKIEKSGWEAQEWLIFQTNCFKSRQNRFIIAFANGANVQTFILRPFLRKIKYIKVKVKVTIFQKYFLSNWH